MTWSTPQFVVAVVLAAAGASVAFLGLVLGNKRVAGSRRVPMVAIWLITALLFTSGVALVSLYRADLLFDLSLTILWAVLFTAMSITVVYIFHPMFRGRK